MRSFAKSHHASPPPWNACERLERQPRDVSCAEAVSSRQQGRGFSRGKNHRPRWPGRTRWKLHVADGGLKARRASRSSRQPLAEERRSVALLRRRLRVWASTAAYLPGGEPRSDCAERGRQRRTRAAHAERRQNRLNWPEQRVNRALFCVLCVLWKRKLLSRTVDF